MTKNFDNNNGKRGHGGRFGRWSYGGCNDDQKKNDEASGSSQS